MVLNIVFTAIQKTVALQVAREIGVEYVSVVQICVQALEVVDFSPRTEHCCWSLTLSSNMDSVHPQTPLR